MRAGSRAAVAACAVLGALAGLGGLGSAQPSTPKPTPTPAACARPNVAASVVHAAHGMIPPMAAQQDIFGSVDVLVSLDADSRITDVQIQRTPSAILNRAALAAARTSSFQTEIKDCRPVAATFLYTVVFPEKLRYARSPSGVRAISIYADAAVTKAPDVAHVEARITAIDTTAAGALAKNDAIFEALRTKFRALGIGDGKIHATRSVHGIPSPVSFETPPPRPGQGYGYESLRQIDVTVDAAGAGNAALAAASVRSVDVLGIRYTLSDPATAYREARDLALADAQTSANRSLTPQMLQLGPLLRVDPPWNERVTPPSALVRFNRTTLAAPAAVPAIPALEVRATATVTYALGQATPPCPRPNAAAVVVRAVPAVTPALAEQQGITGSVQVVVSLDADSNVVGARIQSSPSAVLNQAAITAARQTTFRTEVRDCRPLAADFIYTVDFAKKVTFSTDAPGERTVSVIGQGTVTRAPDAAVVQARITTSGDTAADAIAKNDAALDALKAKLGALGIGENKIASTPPQRMGPARADVTAGGFASVRHVAITVDTVANAGHAAAAAAALAPVDAVAIRYALNDRAAAYREALGIALKDTENAAQDAVTNQRLHLGVVKNIIEPMDHGPPITIVPFHLVPVVGGFKEPDIRIPEVPVHVTVTVTYTIRP